MEFLSESTPMPDGLNVFPWMKVRAKDVVANKLTLAYDGETPPTVKGLPGSRVMLVRFQPMQQSYVNLDIPANEHMVMHPLYPVQYCQGVGFSSDPNRLFFLPEHPDVLAFGVRVPPFSPVGMMRVEICVNITNISASGSFVGDHMEYKIQAFTSTNEDLSNAVALDGAITGEEFVHVIVGDQGGEVKPTLNSQLFASFIFAQDGNATENILHRFFYFEIAKTRQDNYLVRLTLNRSTLLVTDCDGVN